MRYKHRQDRVGMLGHILADRVHDPRIDLPARDLEHGRLAGLKVPFSVPPRRRQLLESGRSVLGPAPD